MINFSTYRGKKVLVTGHTGFKGSWLVSWLTMLGADVIGYALPPQTTPNHFDILKLEKHITHIIGDVRDKDMLASVIQKHKPEFVFHLAAQPLLRRSYREPVLTYETNIMGTVYALDAVRMSETVCAVVSVTSDKCYENREWIYGYRENDPLGGYDPYSSSKGCAELVTAAYRNSFFNPLEYGKKHHVAVASARAGNVIGGGDWAEDRLIADCVRCLVKNEPIVLRHPHATRPWQHVIEPIAGYLLLGMHLYEEGHRYSSAWNFGPHDASIISVEKIVQEIIRLWGTGSYRVETTSTLHEAQLLKLDISKALTQLKWHPAYTIHEALEATITWYKTFYEGTNDMTAFTQRQIKAYMQKEWGDLNDIASGRDLFY